MAAPPSGPAHGRHTHSREEENKSRVGSGRAGSNRFETFLLLRRRCHRLTLCQVRRAAIAAAATFGAFLVQQDSGRKNTAHRLSTRLMPAFLIRDMALLVLFREAVAALSFDRHRHRHTWCDAAPWLHRIIGGGATDRDRQTYTRPFFFLFLFRLSEDFVFSKQQEKSVRVYMHSLTRRRRRRRRRLAQECVPPAHRTHFQVTHVRAAAARSTAKKKRKEKKKTQAYRFSRAPRHGLCASQQPQP